MAKGKQVRFTKNDRVKIKRLERNVLAKQRRIKKNFGVNEWFYFRPLSDIKSGTRAELNQYYKELQSFTNRNNHRYKKVNDVTVPYDEYRELVNNIEKANRNRRKIRNKVNKRLSTPKSKTNDMLNYISGLLGNQKMYFLENIDKEQTLSRIKNTSDFNKMQERFKEESSPNYYDERLHRMKENYIKAIYNPENGLFAEGDVEQIAQLTNRISSMSDMDFYTWYLSDEDLDFVYIYEDVDKQSRLDYLNASIDNYEVGEAD